MRILSGHRGPVRWLTYSPDGRYLASSAEDNTIRLWQLETGYQVLHLRTPGGYAHWIGFEGSGKTLFAANTLSGPQHAWSLNYLAEGVLSCRPLSETKGMLETLKVLARSIFSSVGRKAERLFRQRTDRVGPLRYSADDRLLAFADPPSTIHLIDTTTGREVAAYDWDIGPIYAVAFAPDGMTVAAGGRDFRIVVWDLEV